MKLDAFIYINEDEEEKGDKVMDIYSNAIERNDISRIEKLNKLNDAKTFWDDVRKLTKNVRSDHSFRRWEILAEIRLEEIKQNKRR